MIPAGGEGTRSFGFVHAAILPEPQAGFELLTQVHRFVDMSEAGLRPVREGLIAPRIRDPINSS
jgi:hypothetical protein